MEHHDKNKYLHNNLENKLKKLPISVEDKLILRNILSDYREQVKKNPTDNILISNIKEIEDYLNE